MRQLIPVLVALALTACGPGSLSNTETYKPPPPLALVVLVDPASTAFAQEMHQLASVIRTNATPGEAVVVMLLQPSYGQVYTVLGGDSLSGIAAAHGLALADLEAANAQLGPVAGRNWTLIHPGERVIIPNGAAQNPLVLVSRAPSGPPPPQLVRLPTEPSNPTDYQRAEYSRTVSADNATNAARISAWQAAAAESLQPWQQQVASQLDAKASSPALAYHAIDGQILSSSVAAGLATLGGLSGHRTLLLLGGGQHGPAAMSPGGLSTVSLVIANLADTRAAAAWSASGASAGATSVTVLDPALTQLQLAQVINR